MPDRLIVTIFGLAVGVLGSIGLGVFVHEMLNKRDVPTLALSGLVAFAGVLSIGLLIRTRLTR